MKHLALLLLTLSLVGIRAAELTNPITADGTYTFSLHPGKSYVFAASGDFGGGSLAIQWVDSAGNATAFSQSPAAAAETWSFIAPSTSGQVVLSGATSPSITAAISLADGDNITPAAVAAAIAEDPEAVVSALGYIPAQTAQNSLRMASLPVDSNAITVAGRTYTFQASPSAADEVAIGASRSTAAANLADAINSGSGGGAPHAAVNAYADGSQVGFLAKTAGSAANAYTLTSNSSNIIAERKHFQLGRDAGQVTLGEIAGARRSYNNPLELPTPDGIPSTTHPSVVHINEGFGGFEYWMAFTPWPSGARERPNILCSHDGVNWLVPDGLANPIVSDAFMIGEGLGFSFMADTTLCLLHDGTLAVFYLMATGSDSAVYRQTTSDGITWSTPVRVIGTNASGEHDPAARRGSMSVIAEPDGTYTMFSCGGTDTPATFHRWTSPDTTTWTWQGTCAVEGLTDTQIWHADAVRVGDIYHAIFMSNESSDTGRLYHFTSTDGATWSGSFEAPSVELSGESWDSLSNYRSSIVPRFGKSGLAWDIYVSGRATGTLDASATNGGKPWRIGLFQNVQLATRDNLAAKFRQAMEMAMRVAKLPTNTTLWSTFASGTGAHTTNNAGGIYQVTGATAGSWAFAKLSDQTPLFPWCDHTEGGNNIIDWDSPFVLDVPVMLVAPGSGSRFRCYLGQQNASVDSPTDMTFKGVGFRVENTALKAVIHDGSSEVVTDLSRSLIANRPVRVRIRNSGNGKYTYSVNGVNLATLDGPTGLGTAFVTSLNVAAENQSTASIYQWVVGQISYANLEGID